MRDWESQKLNTLNYRFHARMFLRTSHDFMNPFLPLAKLNIIATAAIPPIHCKTNTRRSKHHGFSPPPSLSLRTATLGDQDVVAGGVVKFWVGSVRWTAPNRVLPTSKMA